MHILYTKLGVGGAAIVILNYRITYIYRIAGLDMIEEISHIESNGGYMMIWMRFLDKLKLEMEDIPEYFEMEPRSAIDNRTVPMRKLKEYFYSEKFKVETMVKSIREKMVKPSSDSNAAVGPSEDLGLDADPGLSK